MTLNISYSIIFLIFVRKREKIMVFWVKTILNVYRYLEKLANAIDKIVISRATNSFYTCSGNLAFNDVMCVSEDILNLTQRKINLINLKIIIENAFSKIDENLAKILVLSYIEKRTCFECADLLNISVRTFFRKLKIALKSFEHALKRENITQEYLENKLKGENWIIEVKNKIQGKNDIFELNSKFAKKICMDYNLKKNNITHQIRNSLLL